VLPKHPDLYTDEELDAWIRHLVDNEVAEGPRLDYKQTISLDKEKDHREAAKDISSFANEVGGCLLYGVPENRVSKEKAIPQKPYGIDPIPDLESRLENVYVDAIRPTLSEWRIRKVPLSEHAGKVAYVAWTPESWAGPHMVEAYNDGRYYRRGQLRAVEMAEHEVRARYERVATARDRLADFLASPELNYIGYALPVALRSRYVACPVPLTADRLDTRSESFRSWLRQHRIPWGSWRPSTYGVRTELSIRDSGKWDDYGEIYRNGALVVWTPTAVTERDDGSYVFAYVDELANLLVFLRFARELYVDNEYFGTLRFLFDVDHYSRSVPTLRFPRSDFRSDWRALLTHDGALRIAIDESAATLQENPNKILKRLADEMYRAFGYWEATCFDENLNLIRE